MTEQSSGTEGAIVDQDLQSGAGEPSLSDVLARLDSLEQKTDDKFRGFGKDLGRLRERIREPGEEPTKGAAPDLDQLRDMVRFEAATSGLPENVRKQLDAAVEGGMTYSAALSLANEFKPAKDESAKDGPPPPPGKGARPAPNSSGMHPTRMSELLAIRRNEPDRYAKLMADDTFDPARLR